MSNILPLTIEAFVAVLLLLTILYCVRLNGQLARLKADEAAMRAMIAELVGATQSAERAIAGLKTTASEAEKTLGDRLGAAERYSGEIARQIESGRELLERLTQIAGARLPASMAPQPRPVAPDPKAIAAAAQAFAARIKERAA